MKKRAAAPAADGDSDIKRLAEEVEKLREELERRPIIGPYPIIVPQPTYVPQPWWLPPQYQPITWTCTTSTSLPGEPA